MDPAEIHIDSTKSVLIAGFIGSILSINFIVDMDRKQRIIAVISGVAMAHYVAPLIANLFHEENYEATLGFLVGLFGMSLCASIFRAIRNSDLWGLVAKRYGNTDGGAS